MLNQTNKTLSLFIVAASFLVTSGLAQAHPHDQGGTPIYNGAEFLFWKRQDALRSHILAFNALMKEHNLVVSSILFSTIKDMEGGQDKNRARARSDSSDNYTGEVCVNIQNASLGVDEENKSKMTDDENPKDVKTCFIWYQEPPANP